MSEREALTAAIEVIAARFRSGNRCPVDKAVVPASEWGALVAALASAPAAKPVVYPDADLSAGLSTDGVLVCGSPESIKRVGRWHHAATAVVPYLQAELEQARIDAKQPTAPAAPAADVRESEDAARLAIGAQLSNVAFNWAQRPGYTLTDADVALLDKLRKEWDAARASKGGKAQ